MAQQYLAVRHPDALLRFGQLRVSDAQGLGPHQAHEHRCEVDGQGDDGIAKAGAEHARDRENQDERGNAQDHVRQEADDAIEPASEVAGDHAERYGDHQGRAD